MLKVTFVRRDGQPFVVEAQIGQSLMEAATSNLVPGILGDCGGCVSCGTCEASVEGPWQGKLEPQADDELALLGDTLERNPKTRLTCQIVMNDALDGIVVHLP